MRVSRIQTSIVIMLPNNASRGYYNYGEREAFQLFEGYTTNSDTSITIRGVRDGDEDIRYNGFPFIITYGKSEERIIKPIYVNEMYSLMSDMTAERREDLMSLANLGVDTINNIQKTFPRDGMVDTLADGLESLSGEDRMALEAMIISAQ